MTMAYQRGDRVILIATADPHTRLTPGSLGTVTGTDPRHGQFSDRSAPEIRFHLGFTLRACP